MYHSQKSYIDRVRYVGSGSTCYFYCITVLIIVNVVGDVVLILFLLDNTAVPYIVVIKFSTHSLAKKMNREYLFENQYWFYKHHYFKYWNIFTAYSTLKYFGDDTCTPSARDVLQEYFVEIRIEMTVELNPFEIQVETRVCAQLYRCLCRDDMEYLLEMYLYLLFQYISQICL